MRKVFLVLLITFFSCSNDDNNDCAIAKQMEIEKFDKLIQLARDSGDETQAQTATRNKEIRIKEFDC